MNSISQPSESEFSSSSSAVGMATRREAASMADLRLNELESSATWPDMEELVLRTCPCWANL
eukprot:CAMPEP_0180668938 /NCGR_PEP_ID=MMETSP1037_2-20121125/63207_1 /TAXON_ID=632150 /ORGANISM="Azadinium spinosum, Strain 3D9" /LENGTH=61 /DNA_ID=CAMNT_0022697731 /DNA_START=13 /DNA_END=195 /DNA_ORIENTATION=-